MTDKMLARLSSDAQYPIEAELCAVNGWSIRQFHSPAAEEFHRAITCLTNRPLTVQHVQCPSGNYCIINGGSGLSVAPNHKAKSIKSQAFQCDKFWSKPEDFIIESQYPGGGTAAVIRSIRDNLGKIRSSQAIHARASFLRIRYTGIKSLNQYKSRGHPKRQPLAKTGEKD